MNEWHSHSAFGEIDIERTEEEMRASLEHAKKRAAGNRRGFAVALFVAGLAVAGNFLIARFDPSDGVVYVPLSLLALVSIVIGWSLWGSAVVYGEN